VEKKLTDIKGYPIEQERPNVDDVFVHLQEGVSPKKHLALQEPKTRVKYLEHLAWCSGILLGATMGMVGGFVIGVFAGVYGG
jgi:hypothetical protein